MYLTLKLLRSLSSSLLVYVVVNDPRSVVSRGVNLQRTPEEEDGEPLEGWGYAAISSFCPMVFRKKNFARATGTATPTSAPCMIVFNPTN